jgi:hypothetical protein
MHCIPRQFLVLQRTLSLALSLLRDIILISKSRENKGLIKVNKRGFKYILSSILTLFKKSILDNKIRGY